MWIEVGTVREGVVRVAELGMLGMLWEEGLSVGGLVCSWGQGSDGLGVEVGSWRVDRKSDWELPHGRPARL